MNNSKKSKAELLHSIEKMKKAVARFKKREELHKSLEKSLRENEQWFKTFADAASEGITITENGVIIDLNKQYANMHSYRQKELMGKSILDLVAPEYREKMSSALTMDASTPYEIVALRKDGTTFLAEVRGKISKLKNRTVRISTIRDITEWKKTEETLRNERNLLRTVVNILPDGIYVKDRECRKIITNTADLRYMDMQNENGVIGKTDFDFFQEETASAFYKDDKSVLNDGQPILNREESYLDKNGQTHWLLTSKMPLKNDKGEIYGIVGIGRDITEQKKAQVALQNERNLLLTLIDTLPDLINYKDTNGRYLLNNRAHLRALGAEKQEDVIGKTMYDFHPAELAKHYEENEHYLIESGDPIIDKEETVYHHDSGKIHWHLTNKAPIKDANGKVASYITISRDITERKRMEEALRETAEKFRFVFENAYDGISLFEETKENEQRRLVDCNESYAEMAGRSREELLRLGSLSDISKYISQSKSESPKHGIVLNGSFSWIRPDARENIIEYTAVPIRMQGKTYIIGIDRDVTERKHAEAEREQLIKELQQALSDIKTLSGLVPICASCKKIRDDKGYWTQVEAYIQEHSQARFSHGLCPDCMKKIYPDFVPKKREE